MMIIIYVYVYYVFFFILATVLFCACIYELIVTMLDCHSGIKSVSINWLIDHNFTHNTFTQTYNLHSLISTAYSHFSLDLCKSQDRVLERPGYSYPLCSHRTIMTLTCTKYC